MYSDLYLSRSLYDYCLYTHTYMVCAEQIWRIKMNSFGTLRAFYDIQAVFVTFKQGMLVCYMFLRYLMPRHSSSVC